MDCRVWIEAARILLELPECVEDELRRYGLTEKAEQLARARERAKVVLLAAGLLASNRRNCPSNIDELINQARLFLAKSKN